MRTPHPLAAVLTERLSRRAGARIIEIGSGSGRTSAALTRAGFAVFSVPDGGALPPAGERAFDGAISTHALLHGTPETIARDVAHIASLLAPETPFVATFGSTEDARFGAGRRISDVTFAPTAGDEIGVAHTFFDESHLRALVEPYFRIESLHAHHVDDIAGGWAHERAPLHGAVHWFLIATRISPDNGARTLRELIDRLADHDVKPALITVGPGGAESVSFNDLLRNARGVAEQLRGNGVAPGEPVAIVAPNSAAWAATCLGILAAGAAAMPLDVRQSDTERSALLASSGCRFIYSADQSRPSALSLSSLAGQPVAAPDDIAFLLHTSGTTGTPKAVPLSHANVLSNIRALVAEDLLGPHDRVLLPLPLHHVYPLVVGLLLPLSIGASIVLPAGISGPELSRTLKIADVSMLVGVPRLYDALLHAIMDGVKTQAPIARWAFSQALGVSVALARRGRFGFGRMAFRRVRRQIGPALWRLACGGAALQETTEASLLGLGFDVRVGYGLTETSPIVTFNRPGRSRIGSAGEPLPGVQLRIAQPDTHGSGEIEVRGANVFAGYRNDDAATRRAFTADGWFKTGDRGRVDAAGYLYVQSRLSETLVLSGGEKLDPDVVERAYECSAVSELAVLIESGKLVALVVPAPASSGELAEHTIRLALTEAEKNLPGYMRLAGFALTEGPLPRTPLGKLRRYLLPRLYQAARMAKTGAAEATMSAADRALLEHPTGQQLWRWLQHRFPNEKLSLDTSLQLDLGVDSLDAITLTMDLERELGLVLEENALAPVVTVRDMLDAAIVAKTAQAPGAEATTLAPIGVIDRGVWYAGNAVIRTVIKSIFRLHVEGAEHLPKRGPYLLCPNHSSYADGPALAAALPWAVLQQVYWTGSVDIMFSNAGRRLFSRLARIVPISQVYGSRSGIDLTAQALRHGHIVVWFPEGWLTTDGSLQPFLPGIGSLVIKEPVPIVPVHIAGTFEAWLPEHPLPRPRRVTIRFGPPLDPQRWTASTLPEPREEAIAAQVMAAVAALSE